MPDHRRDDGCRIIDEREMSTYRSILRHKVLSRSDWVDLLVHRNDNVKD
jgi:hypothetical protein